MSKLVISAAHTIDNPGVVFKGLREADLTRKLLSMIIPHLIRLNVDYITVPLDLNLLDRLNWIKKQKVSVENGDIFFEFHINDGGKRGVEAWYCGEHNENNRSEKLARFITSELSLKFNWTNLGAKSEYDHELKKLIVLSENAIPGTCLELLFIDNEDDIKILNNDQELNAVTEKIADSLNTFLNNNKINQEEINFFKNINKKSVYSTTDYNNEGLDMDLMPFTSTSSYNGSDKNGNKYTSTNTQQSNNIMDRNQRKEMIKSVYKKILNRDPNDSEINNHLNTGISEIELIYTIVEGEEFKTIHSNAKMFTELEKKSKEQERITEIQRKNIEDLQKMIANLNKLLQLKNQYISQMQSELSNYKVIVEGEYYHPERVNKKKSKKIQEKQRKNIIDRIVKILNI